MYTYFCEVICGATVDCDNPAVDSALLVPTSTSTDPDSSFEELLAMLVEVTRCFVTYLDRLDGLGLQFRDGLVDVNGHNLDGKDQRPVRYWRVGSDDSYSKSACLPVTSLDSISAY